MKILKLIGSLYAYFRILSLDVTLGACVMCWFVSCAIEIEIQNEAYLTLGLTVWLIYTLDHLLDAHKTKHKANTARHLFHQKYFDGLSALFVILFLTNTIITFSNLPIKMIFLGTAAFVLVLMHFFLGKIESISHTFFFQKETRIAVVYAFGVCLPALSICEACLDFKILIFASQIFCLAWLNLLLISHFEFQTDLQDNHISLARILGKDKLKKLIHLILWMTLALIALGFVWIEPEFQAIFLLMWLVLALINWKNHFFAQNEAYRVWADLIFLFPLLINILAI